MRNAPLRDVTDWKDGNTAAKTTVLTSKDIRIRILADLQSLSLAGNRFSIVVAIGISVNAYLAIGPAKMVYIATFELTCSVARFNVT